MSASFLFKCDYRPACNQELRVDKPQLAEALRVLRSKGWSVHNGKTVTAGVVIRSRLHFCPEHARSVSYRGRQEESLHPHSILGADD